MTCETSTVANGLMTSLLAGEDFNLTLPDISGSEYTIPDSTLVPVEVLGNGTLTTKVVGGTGMFDELLTAVKAHLQEEFKNNRITGAEYTKAYTALYESALSNAVSYLLQRNQSSNQTALLQAQVVTARIEAAQAKVKLASMLLDSKRLAAEYATAKVNLAKADAEFCSSKYNLDVILPKQAELLTSQKDLLVVQVAEAEYNLANLTPKQAALLAAQIDNAESDLLTKTAQQSLLTEQINTEQYNLANLLPKQASMLNTQIGNGNVDIAVKLKQRELVAEQVETQRAQTTDNRTDGSPVTGSMGKEKELHGQQILNFQREAEVRAAKLFTEAWITTKTVDESLLPPDAFNNISLQTILERVKVANGLNV